MNVARFLLERQPAPAGGLREPIEGVDLALDESVDKADRLLILGEPGSGKSTLLLDLETRLRAVPNTEVLRFDLHGRSSDGIRHEVFGEVSAAGSGRGKRYLLLDSADESRCPASDLASILDMRLRRLRADGWQLVMTSRTAEVAPQLLATFQNADDALTAKPLSHVLYLAPLSTEDVAAIASSRGLAAPAFTDEIERLGLGELAAYPLTLHLLCDIYESDGRFTLTLEEVFERSTSLLLGESPTAPRWHRPNGLSGPEYSTADLRVAAERLAALMLLTDAPDIVVEDDAGPGERAWADYVGMDVVDGAARLVDPGLLKATLRTGLFASVGRKRTFVHRAIGEYLCARYLLRRRLPQSQLSGLLLPPPPVDLLPPRLVGVCTWLLRAQPETHHWLINHDPVALALSGSIQTDSGRRQAVQRLLQDGARILRTLPWSANFSDLTYDGIQKDLEKALSRDATRQVALRLLEDVGAEGAEDALLKIALSERRQFDERRQAVRLLGPTSSVDKLVPMPVEIANLLTTDPNREVLGSYLDATWPANISVTSVLKLLAKPASRYYGSYWSFLRRFAKEVPDSSVKHVLKWVAARPTVRKGRTKDWLDEFVDDLLVNRDINKFAGDSLWRLLVIQVAEHKLRIRIASLSAENRRAFNTYFLNKSDGTAGSLNWATDPDGASLLNADDLGWLVDGAGSGALDKPRAADLARFVVNAGSHEHLAIVWAVRADPAWDDVIKRFEAIPLRSDAAHHLRRQLRRAARAGKRNAGDDRALAHTEAIRKAIGDAFADPKDYWRVYYELAGYGSGSLPHVRTDDISSLPGYALLSAADQKKVSSLEKKFLAAVDSSDLGDAADPGHIFFRNEAGYAALAAICSAGRAADITQDTWEKFADVVVFRPVFYVNDQAEAATKAVVLAELRSAAPGALRASTRRLTELAHNSEVEVFQISDLGPILDYELEDRLLAIVKDNSSASSRRAAAVLVENGSEVTTDWLIAQIQSSSSKEQVTRGLEIVADFQPDSFGSLLLGLARRNQTLAEQCLLEVLHGRYRPPRIIGSVEERLELWVWLVNAFPPDADPAGIGVRAVSAREEVADLRNAVIEGDLPPVSRTPNIWLRGPGMGVRDGEEGCVSAGVQGACGCAVQGGWSEEGRARSRVGDLADVAA